MTTEGLHPQPQHPTRDRFRRFVAAVTATTLAGFLALAWRYLRPSD